MIKMTVETFKCYMMTFFADQKLRSDKGTVIKKKVDSHLYCRPLVPIVCSYGKTL